MTESVEHRAQAFRDRVAALKAEVAKVIVGSEEVVDQVVLTVLAGGHALLEGVPGLGKTLLVRTLASCLQLDFSRIQFTPDLMPADILGTNIVMEDESGNRSFEFQKGPIFGNIVLADEINRATPKTQSALLEAMAEGAITVSGQTYPMKQPFCVLATQNPIEMEGTYPLPEAQLDRFIYKIEVKSGTVDQLVDILSRTTGGEPEQPTPVLTGGEIMDMRALAREVPVAEPVTQYAARLTLATHPDSEHAADITKRYVRYGSSPRGAQALILSGKILALMAGRYNVSFDDIRASALPALRHRIILNFEGEAEGIKADTILEQILASVSDVSERVKNLVPQDS
jgi:MoxR-like ATPase